jgi:hypothetical protein
MLDAMRLRPLALLFLCACLAAQQDGPFVQWSGRRAQVITLKDGQVQARALEAPFSLQLPPPMGGTIRLEGRPYPPDRAVFPPAPRIVAVSDVHGHLDALLTLLQAQGVVDRGFRWAFGRGHLVLAGDIVDRGDQVTQALWFIRGLEGQALRAGGRVHLLLGNHEAMVASGDLRYTAPRYADAPPGVPRVVEAFGPDGEFGRWLRSKPAVVRIGPFLFVHGGLSPALAARTRSLDEINDALRAHFGERGGGPDEAGFLLGPEGPLWFRGYFDGEEGALDDAQVEAVLRAFRAKAIIVGHTTVDRVEALHGRRVYAIDAGLKRGLGEVWIWRQGQAYRGLKDGTRVALD